MNIITLDELKVLLAGQQGLCVSLFMPTHRRGRETEQDPIRFKNLLRQAEEHLQSKGLRSPEAMEMLKPAQRLLNDPVFWRHQSDGLAVFVNSEGCRHYPLPLLFEELAVISDRFHLKPILPLFTGDGHFYILALSRKQVRLLEGTRYTVDEIDLEGMSTSIAEVLQYERFEKQLQFHTGTAGGGERAAVFHGHDPGDEDKGRILRWFQRLDNELSSLLAGEQSPLVLAGVEHLFPPYKEANTYPYLLDEGIPGNPEELHLEELHAKAWPIVHSTFMEAVKEAAARYRQLAGTGQTTTDVKETVSAAHHGRVDILFVTVGVQIWGDFDPNTNTVHIHRESGHGDKDLLDLAAIQSILNGGTVYAVKSEKMPAHAPLAAVFRY